MVVRTSSTPVSIELASSADYDEIERLSRAADHGEVFSPLTASLLEWFLDRNPCGRGFAVIARHAGSRAVLAHFVFYLWKLRRRGPAGPIDVPSALYVRLYVDSTLRRQGVFAAMTRKGLEQLAALGIPVAYTAPNPRSSPGFVKFGMQRIGPLPVRVRPAWRAWPWPASMRRQHVEIERRTRFDDAFADAFDSSLPPHVTLWSPRPAAMLNWRYADRPDVRYDIRYLTRRGRPIGYVVSRSMAIKGQPVLAVCDAWVAPRDEGGLRCGIVDALRAHRGARLVMAIGASADPRLTRAFAHAGFVRCPTALLPQPAVIVGGPIASVPEAFPLPDAHAWYLTPYDWDVF
jgi:hypothetical protein